MKKPDLNRSSEIVFGPFEMAPLRRSCLALLNRSLTKGMLEDGERIPAPSKLEDIMADPDYSDAVAILVVSVSETKPRSVRVNITVPEDMLRKIDAVAKKRGMSRSSFLVNAAQNVIASRHNSHSL